MANKKGEEKKKINKQKKKGNKREREWDHKEHKLHRETDSAGESKSTKPIKSYAL